MGFDCLYENRAAKADFNKGKGLPALSPTTILKALYKKARERAYETKKSFRRNRGYICEA